MWGLFLAKARVCKKKCSGTPGKHPGNTQEMPGKHQGKVHLLIKVASLAKAVGIFNKVKERERKLCPETPRKHPGNT